MQSLQERKERKAMIQRKYYANHKEDRREYARQYYLRTRYIEGDPDQEKGKYFHVTCGTNLDSALLAFIHLKMGCENLLTNIPLKSTEIVQKPAQRNI